MVFIPFLWLFFGSFILVHGRIFKGTFYHSVQVDKSKLTGTNLEASGSARTIFGCQVMSISSGTTGEEAYCFHENQCFVDTLSGLQVGKEKVAELTDPITCFSILDANGGIEYIFLSFILVTKYIKRIHSYQFAFMTRKLCCPMHKRASSMEIINALTNGGVQFHVYNNLDCL